MNKQSTLVQFKFKTQSVHASESLQSKNSRRVGENMERFKGALDCNTIFQAWTSIRVPSFQMQLNQDMAVHLNWWVRWKQNQSWCQKAYGNTLKELERLTLSVKSVDGSSIGDECPSLTPHPNMGLDHIPSKSGLQIINMRFIVSKP